MPAPADPVCEAEFAGLMTPLGPWDGARRIAVAVSGGADSLCLVILTSEWGAARGIETFGLIVDHGLRAASAQEAASTARALAGRNIGSKILTLTDLAAGSGLAERARIARYAALTRCCREAGIVDLLVGHHAGDQAETVLMRRRAGSGPDGLAGMASLIETDEVRLVRPFLDTHPARLRATLRALALRWVEDPSNQDMRALRARLRHELAQPQVAGVAETLLAEAAAEGARRMQRDLEQAKILATACMLRPEGFALLPEALVPPRALAALVRTVAGGGYPPMPGPVAALVRNPRPATLAGTRLVTAGRLGPGWLLIREAAQIKQPVPAVDNTLWDGRFRLRAAPGQAPDLVIDAIGDDAASLRIQTGLPASVLAVMPVLRDADGRRVEGGRFEFVPSSPCVGHPVYGRGQAGSGSEILLRPR